MAELLGAASRRGGASRPPKATTSFLEPGRREWTAAEDDLVRASVARLGTKQWAEVAKELGASGLGLSAKTGKQVRARWVSCLDPRISPGPWTAAEERA